MKKANYSKVLIFAILGYSIVSGTHIFLSGTEELSVRMLIAGSARLSAVLFSLAFVASSLHYFTKSELTATLVKYRPHLGLIFGVSHTFHLMFLIWLQQSIHPVFTLAKTSSLIGGGLAFALMYLMMLTTFPKFRAMLSPKNWNWLHLIGSWWIWFIFAKSYFRKVTTRGEGYLVLGLLMMVFLLRIGRRVLNLFKK